MSERSVGVNAEGLNWAKASEVDKGRNEAKVSATVAAFGGARSDWAIAGEIASGRAL